MLLALALIVNAVLLWPEIRIERVPINDLSFHIAASQRLAQSLTTGDSFLDPWMSQWALGYPLWHFYQPLPHMLAGLWLTVTSRFASAAASFAVLNYLLLVALPASTYIGARQFGLKPIAAGFASILILSVSEIGDLSRYGLSYGAYVRRGSGLYTQLVSYNLLMPALGLANYSLNTGKRRIISACLVAATALSHVVFGYAAILSIGVIALVGPRGARSRRAVRAASILIPAVILIAWFVIPMLLASGEANRCRWDDVWKFDSWGAANIFRTLFSGDFFDYGRGPVMTLSIAFASLLALYRWKRPLPRRLLVLTAVWLAIFFGRTTWGYFMIFLGLPANFHVSRFESVFELFAVLLTAWALAKVVSAAARAGLAARVVSVIALCGMALVIFAERASFLQQNNQWGDESLAAIAQEGAELDASLADIRAILRERPGRVWTGPTGRWAAHFQIAKTQPYTFLSLAGFDELSFLYHSLSWGSDVTAEINERDPYQAQLFAMRAVLAPATQPMPSYFKPRAVHGNLAVYEASSEGYFGLVDIGARYDGPLTSVLNRDWQWMQNPAVRAGAMVALGGDLKGVPEWKMFQALPPLDPRFSTPRGEIISETKQGETYRARLAALRPCYALLKITYFPGQQATVDGKPTPIYRVYPNFCAIPVGAGEHQVVVRYRPGPIKPILLIAGIFLVGLIAQAMRRPDYPALELRLADRLAELATPWATPRAQAALALAVLWILAMHPLFNGSLIDGHEALNYPPRLVEMSRALADQFPPVWAPDLASGHGLPLFEFTPPLLYFVAIPLLKAGFRIANSLQFALAILFALGTPAMYRVARRYGGSRATAVAVTGAWLFSPYMLLDLYVRTAMAEAAALALLPLALYAMLRASDKLSIQTVCFGAFTLALVILGNSGIALPFVFVLMALVLARGIFSRAPAVNVLAGGLALLGGFALSAFFWAPSVLEKNFVKNNLAATLDYDASFFLRIILLLVLGLGGLVLLFGRDKTLSRTSRPNFVDMTVFAIASVGGAVLTLAWESQPSLMFLPALFLPILALYAFERMGIRPAALVLLTFVLMGLTLTQTKGVQTFDDAYYSGDLIALKGINAAAGDEYEPQTVHSPPGFDSTLLKGISSTPLVTPLAVGSASQSFTVDATEHALMQDATFDYPGWTVLVDGREATTSPAPDSGQITFNLPAGTHNVLVELRPTPIRRWSFYVSLVTAALIVLLIAWAVVTAKPFDETKPEGATNARPEKARS